jgi:transcriptional regulator with XRE-family HTH domain
MPDTHFEPEAVDVHVGKMLRHYRKIAGMTQEDLANAMGMQRQQIRKYELAKARITANKLFRAAQIFAVPVANFFSEPDRSYAPKMDQALLAAIAALLQSEEGKELAIVFPRIANPTVRKKIVALAKAVTISASSTSAPG